MAKIFYNGKLIYDGPVKLHTLVLSEPPALMKSATEITGQVTIPYSLASRLVAELDDVVDFQEADLTHLANPNV